MRESMNMTPGSREYRLKLLTTVSAAVLLVSAYGAGRAEAAGSDADNIPLWIEFGGSLNFTDNNPQNYVAPFYSAISAAGLDSPLKFEKAPRYSIDEFGALSFQPEGSEWILSAAIRYGRSSVDRNTHEETPGHPTKFNIGSFSTTFPTKWVQFSDAHAASTERHTVLDFSAGRDVGLGLFGRSGSASLNLGVRFAQFSSQSHGNDNADPKLGFPTKTITQFSQIFTHHKYKNVYWDATRSTRSFHGVGPSLSWHGTAPLAGNTDNAQIALDWGINAAVLFGRQKAKGYHQSSNAHCSGVFAYGLYCSAGVPTNVHPQITHNRSRSVTVPNIGSTLALSFRSGDAKVSFGYRADLFAGAMDTGIDARKSSDLLFHGPFASISIGLGD